MYLDGQNGKKLEYQPCYNYEDIEWIKNHLTKHTEPIDELKRKSGFLWEIFYSAVWYYNNGEEKLLQLNEDKYKGWYCDRNFIFMYGSGQMNYGWSCYGSCHNLFKDSCFPKDELKPLICERDFCTMSFGMLAPKYKSIKYAPTYHDKKELIKCRLNYIFSKFNIYKKSQNFYKKFKKIKRFHSIINK